MGIEDLEQVRRLAEIRLADDDTAVGVVLIVSALAAAEPGHELALGLHLTGDV